MPEEALPGRIYMGGPWQQVFDEISKLGDQLTVLQEDVAFLRGHLVAGNPITAKDIADLKAAAARIRAIDPKKEK